MFNKNTNEYEGYIYLITNLINNKKYVGQTTQTVQKRWIAHCSDAINKPSLTGIDAAIRKYGRDNFSVETIDVVSFTSKDNLTSVLNELEIKYIEELHTSILCGGYNIDDGGNNKIGQGQPVDVYDMDGKLLFNFRTRVEASETLNISIKSITNIIYGHTRNYKNTYVFRNSGDPIDKYDYTPYNFQDIYQFSLETEQIVGYYTSCVEVNQAFGRNDGYISDVLNKEHKTAYGFWWSNFPEYNYKGYEKREHRPKIDLYDSNLNFVDTFFNSTKCGNFLGCRSDMVMDACNPKNKLLTIHGYYCRFHGDDIYSKQLQRSDTKLCNCYDLNDNFITTYISIADGARHVSDDIKKLNSISTGISRCVAGIQKTAYGYKWFYADDPTQPDKSKIITNSQEKAS